ncbi:anion permease [Halochromatium salexigens]|uniref:anion permease n=1 Tax=Halochromatium salexigens TaxID=49447 RepID=UPI003B8371B4
MMEFALRLSLRPQLTGRVQPVGEPLRWGRAQWLMLLVLFAMALTEVASNTASAALLIPLFIGLAPQIDSMAIAMLVALATSCAFLLPVATPPNAIIFGSGQVPQGAMLRSGLWVSAAILPLLFALAALLDARAGGVANAGGSLAGVIWHH